MIQWALDKIILTASFTWWVLCTPTTTILNSAILPLHYVLLGNVSIVHYLCFEASRNSCAQFPGLVYAFLDVSPLYSVTLPSLWQERHTILHPYPLFSHFPFPQVLHVKLDGVGPVHNRPSTDKFHHFVKKNLNQKNDVWHGICCGEWTFSENLSSLALPVCVLWYYEDLEEKADRPNQYWGC